MRKSIFDIISENSNNELEISRILKMSTEEKTLLYNHHKYTLFEYVDDYCFAEWENRGHCINVADFLYAIDYKNLKLKAYTDIEHMLTLIELIYNFWMLTYKDLSDEEDYSPQWYGNYYHLKDVMDDILSQYNYTVYEDTNTNQVLIIEDKQEVTAVAEIIESNLAYRVIQYNHRNLKGDIETKKTILLSLGSELEPKRKELQSLNKQLSNDIFFALNNLNLRHNNKSKDDKNYKEFVANMPDDILEKWYDELYQMILLAFLILDNVERTDKIKKLKSNIEKY